MKKPEIDIKMESPFKHKSHIAEIDKLLLQQIHHIVELRAKKIYDLQVAVALIADVRSIRKLLSKMIDTSFHYLTYCASQTKEVTDEKTRD